MLNTVDHDVVYIAGPMTGIDEFNAPAFRKAAKTLKLNGYTVVSPVELDEDAEFDHTANEITEDVYFSFLKRDIQAIIDGGVKAIVVLPGWETSRGAAAEVELARNLGIPIFSYTDRERVLRPPQWRPQNEENVLEQAQRVVGGDRGDAYGHPYHDFARTAKIATAVLDGFLKDGAEVQPWHIPLLMIGVKISRQVNAAKRDNFVDIAGYARTGEMVSEMMEEQGIERIEQGEFGKEEPK